MQNHRPIRLGLGIAVSLLAALLVLTHWRKSEHSNPRNQETEDGALQEEPGRSNAHNGLESVADARRSGIGNRESPDAIIAGRVVDCMFGLGVRARINTDSGLATFSDPITGAFVIHGAAQDTTTLRVTGNGLETSAVEVNHSDPAVDVMIRVCATRMAGLVLRDEVGAPVSGARVVWKSGARAFDGENVSTWILPALDPDGTEFESETDRSGASRAAITSPAILWVTDPRHGNVTTTRVSPGEERVLVLPDAPVRIQFFDGITSKPIEGLEVEAWSPRDTGSGIISVVSDEDGIVSLWSNAFPLLVRKSGAGVGGSRLVSGSPGLTLMGIASQSNQVLRVHSLPAIGSLLRVELYACGGVLKLIDKEASLPITALVRLKRTADSRCADTESQAPTACTVTSPSDERDNAMGTYRSIDGRLTLPCALTDNASAKDPWSLVVAARGFAPVRVSSARLPTVGEPDLVLDLDRARSRSLCVVHENNVSFKQGLSIYSPRGNLLAWSSRGSPTGIHGPFDWLGGDLLVRIGDAPKWDHRVHALDLEQAELITVRLPASTGKIVVTGVPLDADPSLLLARRGVKRRATNYSPAEFGGGECVFDQLPSGDYLVGPQAWLDGAEGQSMGTRQDSLELAPLPSRTIVPEGGTVTIGWESSWQSGVRLAGCVTCSGPTPVGLFIVPLYSPQNDSAGHSPSGVPTIIFGRREQRLPIDRNGCYEIQPSDPLPTLLVVCALDEGSWGTVEGLHVLETILPGESVDIDTGSVILVDGIQGRTTDIEVRYQIPSQSLRHPLNSFYTFSSSTWPPGSLLRIDGIPLQTRNLVLKNTSGQVRNLPVELTTERAVTIEVEFDALPDASTLPGK